MKRFLRLFPQAMAEWQRDKAPRLSAALAFYTLFSLSPVLILLVFIAGLFFGIEPTQAFLVGKIREFMGMQAAEIIPQVFASARPLSGILATLAGFVVLLWGASSVFSYLRDSFCTIWGHAPHGGRFGIKGFVRHRLIGFLMVAISGALLMATLLSTTVVAAATTFLRDLLPVPAFFFQAADFTVSIGAVTLIFCTMYMVLAPVKQRWTDVLPGSFVMAALFTMGKALIGYYFVKTTVASAYGAAGSVVV
ncbi:MAG TPA: YihY/virulence factor BrkB family protein, partial [bacterium]